MSSSSKILLIEDDPFLVNIYSTKLSLEGFEVLEASDAKKGLRLAEKHSPDLILLDLLLPEVNGFKFLEILKKKKKTKDIPVIVLSNLGEKEDIKRAFDLGVTDYLIKVHFLPEEVIDKIISIVKENR